MFTIKTQNGTVTTITRSDIVILNQESPLLIRGNTKISKTYTNIQSVPEDSSDSSGWKLARKIHHSNAKMIETIPAFIPDAQVSQYHDAEGDDSLNSSGCHTPSPELVQPLLDSPLPQTQSVEENFNDDDSETQSSFLRYFISSKGPPQIILIVIFFALAYGSLVGVVPAVMTDKYARLNHGYQGQRRCSDLDQKPQACTDGSSDAQTAAAAASFVSNGLAFFTSSLVGSLSDEYGRRKFLLLGQFLSCFPPLCLVVIQILDEMHPMWYYVASSSTGLVSFISIALSALSDVMPKEWRAPCFGLLISGFSLGLSLSPALALAFTHMGVSVVAFCMIISSLFFAICFLPETLSPETLQEAKIKRMNNERIHSFSFSRFLLRPLRELTILNRNGLFRLLSVLAFFSGMSTSADQTLLVYYAEDKLGFTDRDIAILFLIFGCLGILVQSVLLKLFTDIIGEKFVVVVAFFFGALHNSIYAFASTKLLIFVACAVGTFTGMSFPTISAIKSNNVDEFEQGRIQGALFALSSLAGALGPGCLRLAYQYSKNTHHPGSFFLLASFFYLVAMICGCALPRDKANSKRNSLDCDSQAENNNSSSLENSDDIEF